MLHTTLTAFRCKNNITLQYPTIALSLPEWSVKIYTDISRVPSCWDEIVGSQNMFLERNYLYAIQQSLPLYTQCCYLILYHNNIPSGVALCQILEFKGSENIQQKVLPEDECVLTKVSKSLKEFVAKQVSLHILVCGNLLLTGENAFILPISDTEKQLQIISEATDKARLFIENLYGINLPITLFKEFYISQHNPGTALSDSNPFLTEPSMELNLAASWNSFDDYLKAVSSKYRIRAKRAFKKLNGLQTQALSYEYLAAHSQETHHLYKAIADSANFNMVYLREDYFANLKKHLNDDFEVIGYFDSEVLVGFCTMLKNGEHAEAHFLGLNDAYNSSHQLYLNMLFEMIRTAIRWGSHKLVFARTAPEIKSSVGATPQKIRCYIRHRNPIANRLLAPTINYIRPEEDAWQQRHPFKDSAESEAD